MVLCILCVGGVCAVFGEDVTGFCCPTTTAEITNFPAFAGLLKELRAGAHTTLVTVNGDFLSPNLLSPLDKGRSMIDCFNRLGVTHACLGNHEGDLGLKELHRRSAEFKGVFLNSNIPSLNSPKMPFLRPWDAVTTPAGRTIGLLGLLLCEPGAFRDGTFKGHSIEPVVPSVTKWAHLLRSEQAADLVLPLTHQSMWSDEKLAAAGLHLPVILGGHEHEVLLRDVTEPPRTQQVVTADGTKGLPSASLSWAACKPGAHADHAGSSLIVKAGQNCDHAAVCDIHFAAEDEMPAETWAGAGVKMRVWFEDVAERTEKNNVCEEMRTAVADHLSVIDTLRHEVVVGLQESEVVESLACSLA